MKIFIYSLVFSLFLGLTSCATRVKTRPAKITYVKVAPRNHKVVYVKGNRYYHWNGQHYRKTKRGYVVVRM